MFTRVQLVLLCSVVALLASSAVLVVLSMLPHHPLRPRPKPRAPLAVELIEPARTGPAQPSRGLSIESSGFGTILSAPGRKFIPAGEPTLAAAQPVADQVAGLIRLFSRLAPVPPSDELTTFNLDIPPPQFGTIILRDGCLKLAERGEPHAILPAGARLYIDGEGYLTAGVVSNGTATSPRLGEPAWWDGGGGWQIEATALKQIQAKCGPGDAVLIGSAQSVLASQAAADEAAASNIVTMYGLPWATALTEVHECRIRFAQNSGVDPTKIIATYCGNTPPSPVADQRSCPADTTLSGGLCRTPEGYIRPVSKF
jgi:hypothetical protein